MIGEQIAVEYLQRLGYTVLERNAVYSGCEVDVICEGRFDENGEIVKPSFFERLFGKKEKGERVVVFCEVKTRSGNEYGTGAEAVTPYKAGRYTLAAKQYMQSKGEYGRAVRFDIIEVGQDGEVYHIVNAFDTRDAKFPKNRP